jgi:beta-mannosidase
MTTSQQSSVSCHTITELHTGWTFARSAPNACADADGLNQFSAQWLSARVPATVAQCLAADFDTIGRYDAEDWWFRCHFSAPKAAAGERLRLRFDGLATLAEVWLNGKPILTSRNMFIQHSVDITEQVQADNELVVCLRSLDYELAQRKPRPRWKTALIEQQNLRWVRTTLLGRMPGWTPPIQPVGIWKPIVLEHVSTLDLVSMNLQAHAQGSQGHIKLQASINLLNGAHARQARLRIHDQTYPVNITAGDSINLDANLVIPNVPLWWPHTHGKPTLLPCKLELEVNGNWITIDCGNIGFKDLQLNRDEGLVQFIINGVPVFCRGGCWTTDDFIGLHGDPEQLRRTLMLARDAGLNMLRVGGTMTYESDAFYALCDELGILVWQEFMFANMDYPVADPGFRAEIDREATYQLNRFQRHASIAAYCGGSEVQQQAAMLSLPAEEWSNEFFDTALPALCTQWHAGIPYFPSSPCEGALPFHSGVGIAHYYGVGAYRRPIADVQQANVKFATECLGFSNVPEPQTMALILGGATPPAHHPRWKLRQPRDNGAGWDFEDVRDHYLKVLFDLDPVTLRSQDTERYYALSRVVSGEVMRRVYAEWRAPHSQCGGGLVWFFKDLWPGAGWGIIDSTGMPKAAYWYLKRAWAQRTVAITDHGLDGIRLHVLNEQDSPMQGKIELALYQSGRVRVAHAENEFQLPARGTLTLEADAMLGRFVDTAYAYRFGAPQHDVTVARLLAADGSVLAEDFHFPQGLDLPQQLPTQLQLNAQRRDDGCVLVELSCDTFLQSMQFECSGFLPDDNYFHLAPQTRKQVVFRPIDSTPRKFKAYAAALNMKESVTLRAD